MLNLEFRIQFYFRRTQTRKIDLLFKIPLKSGNKTNVHLLFEHKNCEFDVRKSGQIRLAQAARPSSQLW
ncbi:Rpn family recombination-promoting nuclease/putative transposase [Leptospira noguchii]|uniref:Rpn family recombination-promoting nuclease/putative transposase n=1 Tax=Leptospira noguchii TaxID=28182 RepID=UPI001E31ADF3|nr:Rpn family recombination-promoting nuclease/putative transposase [Leptospira noguchii]